MRININNYEEYLLSYIDNELGDEEKKEFLAFLKKHPELQKEFRLLQSTKLTGEDEMVFPYKQYLYRSEIPEKKKVIALKKIWLAAAVAASVAFVLMAYFSVNRSYKPSPEMAFEYKIKDTATLQITLPPQSSAQNKTVHMAGTALSKKEAKLQESKQKPSFIKQDSAALLAHTHAEEKNIKEEAIPVLPISRSFEEDIITNIKKTALAQASEKINPLPMNQNKVENNQNKRSLITRSFTKEEMDSTITDKLADIHNKVVHPLKTLNIKEVKIGNVSFVFNP